MKKITVEYFAVLREQAGLDREVVETDGATAADLYAELQQRHSFADRTTLKVAVNDEFSDWNESLSDGDSVVFIPPVAGG
jgi:molybdopterin converting factor subunit 1